MQIEDILQSYYENFDEEDRLSSRHGTIEFHTTKTYINRYLEQGMRLLDVGAGTGRYSLHYATQGYNVTAVELVQRYVDIIRSKKDENMRLSVSQGDARNLLFDDDTFDVTLVMGPMYHLFTKEDKAKAASEAYRVTRHGGVAFFSFLTHDSVLLEWMRGGHLAKGIANGMVSSKFNCINEPPKLIFDTDYVEDFERRMNDAGFMHLHSVAQEGMSYHIRDILDKADKALYDAWLKYHLYTCERKDLIGWSSHVLYVGRKP